MVYILASEERQGSVGLTSKAKRRVLMLPATAKVGALSDKLNGSLAYFGPKGKRLSNDALLRSVLLLNGGPEKLVAAQLPGMAVVGPACYF
jgi:hypothetical protein